MSIGEVFLGGSVAGGLPGIPAMETFLNQDSAAYIQNARHELAALRSDIITELGGNATDSYLKAAFLSYLDAADLNLAKALA